MSVLEPGELEESPLADLHAIASQLGIESYRRLRRDELIAAILRSQGSDDAAVAEPEPAPADDDAEPAPADEPAARPVAEAEPEPVEEEPAPPEADIRSGVLDVLPNGSGFIRADAFAHSRDDVYVSPAQIRRCELRAGDAVTGPVRPPRRSERYPSLVHVETVNGGPAEPPAERPRFEDLTPVFASERLAAPPELERAPFGKGSRVIVGGPAGAGASTLLRAVAAALAERHPEMDLTVALVGVRPEEVAEWRRELDAPVVGGSFDDPPERQGDAVSMAVERAKRAAERGEDAAVVIDALDAMPPAAVRRTLAAARNTEEAGSVTVIAATGVAPEPRRLATTRILLESPAGGSQSALRLGEESGTLRADLLA